jgi:hypothetical protein
MTYKYISLGMNLGHSGAGRVSWFHDECALKMGIVAGGNPERTNDVPPKGTKCYCCGKEVVEETRPLTVKCDSCGQQWMQGDLFRCPKCGYRWCMPCSFKLKGTNSLPIGKMMSCPICEYTIRLDDKISPEDFDKLRELPTFGKKTFRNSDNLKVEGTI